MSAHREIPWSRPTQLTFQQDCSRQMVPDSPPAECPRPCCYRHRATTLFIANSATNNISTYTVKTDGTLTAGSSSATTGTTPLSMAIDSASHFLFVANQGSQIDPASGTVSVFTIQSGGLTEVAGSPFRVAPLSAPSGPGPSASGSDARRKIPVRGQSV